MCPFTRPPSVPAPSTPIAEQHPKGPTRDPQASHRRQAPPPCDPKPVCSFPGRPACLPAWGPRSFSRRDTLPQPPRPGPRRAGQQPRDGLPRRGPGAVHLLHAESSSSRQESASAPGSAPSSHRSFASPLGAASRASLGNTRPLTDMTTPSSKHRRMHIVTDGRNGPGLPVPVSLQAPQTREPTPWSLSLPQHLAS